MPFHGLGLALQQVRQSSGLFLPFGVERLEWRGDSPSVLWVKIALDDSTPEIHRATLTYYNEEGEVQGQAWACN